MLYKAVLYTVFYPSQWEYYLQEEVIDKRKGKVTQERKEYYSLWSNLTRHRYYINKDRYETPNLGFLYLLTLSATPSKEEALYVAEKVRNHPRFLESLLEAESLHVSVIEVNSSIEKVPDLDIYGKPLIPKPKPKYLEEATVEDRVLADILDLNKIDENLQLSKISQLEYEDKANEILETGLTKL